MSGRVEALILEPGLDFGGSRRARFLARCRPMRLLNGLGHLRQFTMFNPKALARVTSVE
jgi:hypothetical protein